MKTKLLSALNLLKSIILKVYSLAPLLSGVILGYIFKPELKIIMDAGILIIKGLV